jgi:hypothetical protein
MNNSIENLYTKDSNESSPIALDNLILNAAQQSCKKSTRRPRKWLYLLSSAAVLVMGITVVFNLQNQNSEMKVAPESLDYGILKEDSRTKTVAAPALAPSARPQKKRKRVTPDKANQAGLLGKVVSQEPTIKFEQDSDTPQTENKPQVILEKVFPLESAVNALELEEVSDDKFKQTSDVVIVTGMRKAAKPVPELKQEKSLLPKSIELDNLEALIKAKNYKKAQVLLEQLQNTYPNYNWQKYKVSILDSKK